MHYLCAMATLSRRLGASGSLRSLAGDLVASDAFQYRSGP